MSQEEQSSSGFLGGLFQPGVSSRIILSLKVVLVVLLLLLGFIAITGQGNVHVYIMMTLAGVLLGLVQWFTTQQAHLAHEQERKEKEELLVKQNQYHSPKKFQAKNDEAEPNPPPECPFHRPAASASKQEEPKVEQKKPEKVQEKEPEKVLQGEKPEKVLQEDKPEKVLQEEKPEKVQEEEEQEEEPVVSEQKPSEPAGAASSGKRQGGPRRRIRAGD